MSADINIPNRTQILVKDLIFQEKYNLTHTQTDLMAYLVNVTKWAMEVDGYFIITTKKIISDLPQIGRKTLESSLKALKDLGLIQSKIIEVKEWQRNPKVRGIRLTQKGKEYNQKLSLPTQDREKKALEKEIKKLKETIKELQIKIEKEEPKTQKEETIKREEPQKDKLDKFIEKITNYFVISGKPICNLVPSYEKETTFYINSYKKLSKITPQEQYKQLSNPKEIYQFWKWLYQNQKRVGDKIDFTKPPTLKELKDRYINRTIKIDKKSYTIIDFTLEENQVKIKIKDQNQKTAFLINSKTKKEVRFDLDYAQKVILEVLGVDICF